MSAENSIFKVQFLRESIFVRFFFQKTLCMDSFDRRLPKKYPPKISIISFLVAAQKKSRCLCGLALKQGSAKGFPCCLPRAGKTVFSLQCKYDCRETAVALRFRFSVSRIHYIRFWIQCFGKACRFKALQLCDDALFRFVDTVFRNIAAHT